MLTTGGRKDRDLFYNGERVAKIQKAYASCYDSARYLINRESPTLMQVDICFMYYRGDELLLSSISTVPTDIFPRCVRARPDLADFSHPLRRQIEHCLKGYRNLRWCRLDVQNNEHLCTIEIDRATRRATLWVFQVAISQPHGRLSEVSEHYGMV
jgi:hypothetical protein